MSGMSDTITLGLVLILIFGSVCLYLYTRIQQAETKINLLESILLDLKMTNELKAYPTMPPPVPADISEMAQELSFSEFKPQESVQVKPFVDEEDLVQEAPSSTASVNEAQETTSVPVQSGMKVTPNYEAMTLKELRDLAKERKLQGVSTLKRSELVDLLKQSDNKQSGSSMFESMAVSDISSNAEEISIDA